MQQVDYASAAYSANQNPQAYYEHNGSYALPPLESQSPTYGNNFIPQQGPGVQPPYSPQRWAPGQLPVLTAFSMITYCAYIPFLPANLRSQAYSSNSPTQATQSWPSGPTSTSYSDSTAPQSFNRPLSPGYSYSPTTGAGSSVAASPTSDVVPPPRRRISPGSTRDHAATARSSGNRPTGVQKCSSCKATSSPEWRKGPSGKKELCNAYVIFVSYFFRICLNISLF